MTDAESVAFVFIKALKSLKRAERGEVLAAIAEDKALREDFLDLITFAERRDEPSRPFEEYEHERNQKMGKSN